MKKKTQKKNTQRQGCMAQMKKISITTATKHNNNNQINEEYVFKKIMSKKKNTLTADDVQE